jgi:2-polyprenyl-3-methyl-5-hydroxy-6-metoxy-1,4-benzoquinol methylase
MGFFRSGQTMKHQTMAPATEWDHSSHHEFYEKYAAQSLRSGTVDRFRRIRDAILRVIENQKNPQLYAVADIGCNAGTQSLLWAELGYKVHGLDVNGQLLELARRRAVKAGYEIEFAVGTATSLPWAEASMDVCLAIELLEHVPDWQTCLDEFTRVVRPGGVLFLTTSNRLCPRQNEFNLPLYSWYPARVKRWCEHLAMTTKPQLANYAKYPAVNWLTVREWRAELEMRGFDCMDRFDLVDITKKGTFFKAILASIRAVPTLRWLAHLTTPTTTLLAVKRLKGK